MSDETNIPATTVVPTTHVTVVGGGITALAAARDAVRRGAEVTVVEARDRWGGMILTTDFLGAPIDEAADAFLARVPEAVGLCEELGLQDRFTQPAATRAKVWLDGELKWFPEGSVLGVPLDAGSVAPLLSPAGLTAVQQGMGRSDAALVGDVELGPFLRARFGDELVDRVVAPLVGGINAGDPDRMSLRAVTPQLASAAEEGGNLVEALRRRAAAAPEGPVFHGLRGGTATLVRALVADLEARGARLRTSTAVRSLDDLPDGAVILTTPAAVTADLVRPVSPTAAAELDRIETVSVTLVTLAWDRTDVPLPLDASGFLVPRDAGMLLAAASWGSAKWAHWDDGHHVIVRASCGHRDDPRGATLSDQELVDGLRADLATTMGITAAPLATRISRWHDGFHQYDLGHLDRVDRIDAALAEDTGGRVAVAGAAYRGLGIPACIAQGRHAVDRILRGAQHSN